MAISAANRGFAHPVAAPGDSVVEEAQGVFGEGRAGLGDVGGVVAEIGEDEVFEEQAAVGVRIGSHAGVAFGREGFAVGEEDSVGRAGRWRHDENARQIVTFSLIRRRVPSGYQTMRSGATPKSSGITRAFGLRPDRLRARKHATSAPWLMYSRWPTQLRRVKGRVSVKGRESPTSLLSSLTRRYSMWSFASDG